MDGRPQGTLEIKTFKLEHWYLYVWLMVVHRKGNVNVEYSKRYSFVTH